MLPYKDRQVPQHTAIDMDNKDPLRGIVECEAPRDQTKYITKYVGGLAVLFFRRSNKQWAKGIVARRFHGNARVRHVPW